MLFDNATQTITGVSVKEKGSNYVNPKVVITNGDGSDAKFSIVIRDGSVFSIVVTNAGRGYTYAPTIDIVESDVEAFVESDTIGLPRSISIIDNGGAYHLDKTIASTFNSNFVVSLSGNNYTFKKGEIVVQRLSGSEVARAEVVEFRSGGNLLKLENVQGTLRENVENWSCLPTPRIRH